VHLILLFIELINGLKLIEVELGPGPLFLILSILLDLEVDIGPGGCNQREDQVNDHQRQQLRADKIAATVNATIILTDMYISLVSVVLMMHR